MRLVRDVAEGTNTLSRSFYRCATAEHLIVEGDDKLSGPEEFRTVFIRKEIPRYSETKLKHTQIYFHP
ncbi:hypothetical protein HZ326_24853 [Fusarium oxysporum f. sp. albedinis]|nr:hypothetical protein HZ326_24853 [Fusarium oxysporum f. sp. albedinis]